MMTEQATIESPRPASEEACASVCNDDRGHFADKELSTTGKTNVSNLVQKKPRAFGKLIGISSVVMAMALPVGIVPRVVQNQEIDKAQAKAEEHIPVVSVAKSETAPSQLNLNLPGAIEAIVETPIYARTNGYVRQRYADIGDRVSAGQLLAAIETPEIDESQRETQAQVLTNIAGKAQSEANRERASADLARAIAELSQSKANLVQLEADEKFAQSTFARWEKLGAQGAVSLQDVDEKETRLKMARASKQAGLDRIAGAESEVVAARARLRAEQANVNVSSANIVAAQARANRSTSEKSFQNVVSPFAGVITERNVDQGSLVTSGSDSSRLPLYKLARIDTAKVYVDVPQYSAQGIRVGQPVNVFLKEFPGKTFTGTVARTSVALDATARTLRTEIHIANKELLLVPGMYADVTFSVPRPSEVVLIPANALVMRAEGPQVVTLTKNNHVHYRAVRLGEDLGKQVEIVAGLPKNEMVVVNPMDTLTEGTAVSISK
jgi:RND family efflux transporter MFP subunit